MKTRLVILMSLCACTGSAFAEQLNIQARLYRPAWEWAPYYQDAIQDVALSRGIDSGLIDASNQIAKFGRGFRDGSTGGIRVLNTTVSDERTVFRGLLGQQMRDSRPQSDTILLSGPGVTRTFRAYSDSTGRHIELFREVRTVGFAQRLISSDEEIRVNRETLANVKFSGIFGIRAKRQLDGSLPPGNGGGGDNDGDGDGGTENPPIVLVPLPPAVWVGGLGLVLAGVAKRRF